MVSKFIIKQGQWTLLNLSEVDRMKTKVTIIFISLLAAVICMTGGYGQWKETLTIKGDIDVIESDLETGESLYSTTPALDTPALEYSPHPVKNIEEDILGGAGENSSPQEPAESSTPSAAVDSESQSPGDNGGPAAEQ